VREVPARRLLSISGTVIDCEGWPIPDVGIRAAGTYPLERGRHEVETLWEQWVTTDHNGFYEVLVPPGWSGMLFPEHEAYDFWDGRMVSPADVCEDAGL
jgi:hypothetical protein